MRVGKILSVRPHEKADKLYLVEVDVGKVSVTHARTHSRTRTYVHLQHLKLGLAIE